MIVYFTGTGNSRYAAEKLSAVLGEETVDAFDFIRAQSAAELASSTPWVFVCPTYAWRIPRVFEDFLTRSRFSGERRAYFVMTCGGGIGQAAGPLSKLCGRLGLTFMGVAPIIMPENYTAMFAVPGSAEAEAIIKAAETPLQSAAERIRARECFPRSSSDVIGAIETYVVNAPFYRLCVKDTPFFATAECTHCGVCERGCPLGNIMLAADGPHWHGHCTHCMACINRCPAAAVEYGGKSAGKPRYVCPHT